ncbi:T9SS type A sorting domain-containing protein [candidate division KSB1 bacterium]|nr:T9SS type A sorting domain-containing protein [candidate division KSB1 bacterium]
MLAVEKITKQKFDFSLKIFILGLILIPNSIIAQNFKLSATDQKTYIIEFQMQNFRLEEFYDDRLGVSQEYIIPIFDRSVVISSENSFLLSQTGFSLVLPEKAVPKIRIVEYEFDEIPGLNLAVVPDTILPASAPGTIREPFKVIYGGVQRFAGLPLHSFQILPFSYEEKRLRIFKRIVLEFKFEQDLPTVFESGISGSIENLLQNVVLNSQQLKFVPHTKESNLQKKKREFWYNPQQSYIKLLIFEDGIYRVDYSDLSNVGVDPGLIEPDMLTLYYKGEPYPIFVSAGNHANFEPADFIEFYGQRNRGSDEFYNEYSDTSVYWLTWEQTTPVRMPIRNVASVPVNPLQTFYFHDHFEEEKFYYNGDNSFAIFNSETVSGERWIWQRIFAGELVSFSFRLENYAPSSKPDSLVIKVRGITKDSVSPDHHIAIRLNGMALSDFFFDDVEEVIHKVAIPENSLLNGDNELVIQSMGDTGAQLDAIYFDWFEVFYSRNFTAVNNQLQFNSTQQGLVSFELSNFEQDSIIIYDLTNLARLDGFILTEMNGKYTVAFSDSIEKLTRYLAAGIEAIKKPHRILLDNPSDLHDENQQAEYVIITHRKFWQQAMQLAEYRQQDQGLSSIVIDIEDILDEFNFGLMDPLASRWFLQYASKFWQSPKPRFVLFFGDASWDFKNNSASSFKNNYVPTFGNPVSDNRLVSIDGESDFLPDLFTGRLPVSSVEEAEDIVAKIKLYENSEPALWKKNIVFLNGGITTGEHSAFRSQSEGLINKYVTPQPFGGNPIRIYKQTTDRIPGELQDEIFSALNDGALWFSFSGHAGSSSWELMLDNQDIHNLNNTNKLPFITSMTCHTARFANPVIDSFGELFMRKQDVGAIGFWGTSGWGYIFQDGILLNGLFGSLLQDHVETLGEATTLAKLHLWNFLGLSQINVSTIDQYTLLGDPALRLSIPVKPDLLIQNNNISIFPQEPSQSDSVLKVNFLVSNQGLFPQDSVNVLLIVKAQDNPANKSESKILIPPMGYQSEINTFVNIHGIVGEAVLEIQLDPDGLIDEIDENNNRAEINFYIFSTRISIAKPLPYGVISDQQPTFQVYSPEAISEVPRKTYFELDTMREFNSQFKIQSGPITESPIVTTWQPGIVLAEGVYFWRSRIEENMQLSQWLTGEFTLTSETNSSKWSQNVKTGFILTPENQLRIHEGVVQLARDSLFSLFGMLSSGTIGPGTQWQQVLLDIEHPNATTSHSLSISAYDRFSREWKFQKEIVNELTISLEDLDSNRYSQIQLHLTLNSQDGIFTPAFRGWQVDFSHVADLATHPTLISVHPDSILEGEEINVEFSIHNVGLADVDSVMIRIDLQNPTTNWDSLATVVIPHIGLDESTQTSISFNSAGLRGDQKLRVWIDPSDRIIELSETNNLYSKRFFVSGDSIRPDIRITFDDREILPGDFVSANPKILIEVSDNSPLSINDTSLVQLRLDGIIISYSSNMDRVEFMPVDLTQSNGSGVIITYFPQLEPGQHVLEVIATDATMNTSIGKAEFSVDSDFVFRDVMNVPNPFFSETNFTYVLTQTANRVKLSIYTIAGRKIHEIRDLPATAGFNLYLWDGLDADGDKIANGVYLYQLTASLAGKNTSTISKFIVMR